MKIINFAQLAQQAFINLYGVSGKVIEGKVFLYDEDQEDYVETSHLTKDFDDEMQKLVENEQYKINRANEYPSIEDQLDALYHEGYDGWKAAVQAVKDKYPKPE